jgi:hypothetical protein
MHRALLLILLSTSLQTHYLVSQDRFDSGPHKGFLKSPTEQFIVEIREPFEVKIVHGIISGVRGEPMPDVYFEIRDRFGRVRASKTDRLGKFKIPNTSPGNYSFKTTRNGFQSVIGKISVSQKPPKEALIRLAMSVGV